MGEKVEREEEISRQREMVGAEDPQEVKHKADVSAIEERESRGWRGIYSTGEMENSGNLGEGGNFGGGLTPHRRAETTWWGKREVRIFGLR